MSPNFKAALWLTTALALLLVPGISWSQDKGDQVPMFHAQNDGSIILEAVTLPSELGAQFVPYVCLRNPNAPTANCYLIDAAGKRVFQFPVTLTRAP